MASKGGSQSGMDGMKALLAAVAHAEKGEAGGPEGAAEHDSSASAAAQQEPRQGGAARERSGPATRRKRGRRTDQGSAASNAASAAKSSTPKRRRARKATSPASRAAAIEPSPQRSPYAPRTRTATGSTTPKGAAARASPQSSSYRRRRRQTPNAAGKLSPSEPVLGTRDALFDLVAEEPPYTKPPASGASAARRHFKAWLQQWGEHVDAHPDHSSAAVAGPSDADAGAAADSAAAAAVSVGTLPAEDLRRARLRAHPLVRRWAQHEWLYTHLDRPLLDGSELEEQLAARGITRLPPLHRTEWSMLRQLCGRPRRFSPLFLQHARSALQRSREVLRWAHRGLEPLGDVAPDTPVPFAVPAPLRVGQRVTVKLPGGGSCAQGFVLTVQESTLQYRILFDRPDLRPTDVSLDALASHGRQVLLLPPAPGSGRTVTEAVPEARRVLDSLVFTHALFDVNWQRAAAEREDEERGAAGGAWSLPQQLCGGALQPGTVARAALLLDRRHCLLRALKELNDAVEEDRLPAGEAERRGAARRRAWLVANLGALKPALRAVRRALHAQLRVSLAALRAIVADEQAPEPLRQRAAAALDEVVDLGVLHASRCADAVVCDVEAELPGDGPDRGHGLSPRASLQAEAEAGYGARDAAVPADAKGAGGSGDASSGAGKDGEEERGPMSPPSRKRPRGHGPRGLRPLEALEVATQRDARAAVAVAACTQWCVELGLPSRQAGRALSVLTQQAEQYHSHNANICQQLESSVASVVTACSADARE